MTTKKQERLKWLKWQSHCAGTTRVEVTIRTAWKGDSSRGYSRQTEMERRWHDVADCSKHGQQRPETLSRRQHCQYHCLILISPDTQLMYIYLNAYHCILFSSRVKVRIKSICHWRSHTCLFQSRRKQWEPSTMMGWLSWATLEGASHKAQMTTARAPSSFSDYPF